jgi:soluble lytic murein transglycosylase-like protein
MSDYKKNFKGLKLKGETIVDGSLARERSIKENLPAKFVIEKNKNLSSGSTLWNDLRTFEFAGKLAVQSYDKEIRKSAEKHNLDPDLIRAVMYAENARGNYMGGAYIADKAGISSSIMPMNIQNNRWSSLVNKRPDDLLDAQNNVEAGTVLLKRIKERVNKPTVEKISTLWNDIDNKYTNEFGEYVGDVYRRKPWKKID